MSAQEELRRHYQQWRTLTEIEGQGIRAAQWDQVAICQSEKQLLQTQIKSGGALLQQELNGAANRIAIEREFELMVKDLLAREMENSQALAIQRQLAEQHHLELQQTSRQLRQIHQAYSSERQIVWQSYS